MEYNFPMTLNRQFKNKLEDLHDKYGDKIMKIEGMSPDQLDTCKFFKGFIDSKTVADATIDDNANVTSRNICTMLDESMKPFTKLLSRNKIYSQMSKDFGKEDADTFLEEAVNGRLYEHDSHLSSYMPYCFAFSVEQIVENGLFFIGEMKAESPKHWDTFNHHILEFISYATQMQAGAVGLPDYLIYAYYFFKNDTKNMGETEAKKYRDQKFQEFIFNLNQPYLKKGVQSAYTNVSILDLDHIVKFFSDKKYPDGTNILEYVDELFEFQSAFLEYSTELRRKKWFTFPVISASLLFKDGEYKDIETFEMVVSHNYKHGFNEVNIMNVEEVTGVSSCCRMVSDSNELRKVFNSIGGSDLNVGSTKVVTINFSRLAMESDSWNGFLSEVRRLTRLIHKYHYSHRKILQELIDVGMLPLYTHKMMNLTDQFATIGLNGIYEAVKLYHGIDEDSTGVFYSERGFGLVEEIFMTIDAENNTTVKKYGFLSNKEVVPFESGAIKSNKKDRLILGDVNVDNMLGKGYNIYGNQWIPLKEKASIYSRIDAAKLDEYCDGGSILHLNFGEDFDTVEEAIEFARMLAKKGVKYYSKISMIDICKNDHSFFGKICPFCNTPSVSKGIKIVGYMVKQDSYKQERKDELGLRQFYNASEE